MEEDKYITEYYRDRQRSYTCEISRYKDWEDIYLKRTNEYIGRPIIDYQSLITFDIQKSKDSCDALLMYLHQDRAKFKESAKNSLAKNKLKYILL
jgi:hypothetical protein